MNQATRRGFTLVEMLVVIVIISMLAGLLIPAISGARARAKRTECGNNQRELSVAFQQYETAKQRLPGYINRYPAADINGQSFSWPVVLLEYLGRNDVWDQWRDGSVTAAIKRTSVAPSISQFTCPADFDAGDAGLSYVVNCGTEDDSSSTTYPRDYAANGVFHNRFDTNSTAPSPPNPADWVTIRTERIPDGAAQTLLLSENLQATRWFDGSFDAGDGPAPTITEAQIGMVWLPTTSATPALRINQDKDYTGPTNMAHARPSSNHPGGVVVTYCDGHQGFLDDSEIDYHAYASQMAADDAHANPAIP